MSMWTDDRVEEAKRRWKDGQSASEIARAIGHVTRNAVVGKLHRMGLTDKDRHNPRRISPHVTIPKPQKKRVIHKPKPVPVEPPVVIDGAHVTLLDLTEGMCRWPIGDPRDDDFHFCGRPVKDGSCYCSGHHAQAYVPNKPKISNAHIAIGKSKKWAV